MVDNVKIQLLNVTFVSVTDLSVCSASWSAGVSLYNDWYCCDCVRLCTEWYCCDCVRLCTEW